MKRDIEPILADGAPFTAEERIRLRQWEFENGGLPSVSKLVDEQELITEIRAQILGEVGLEKPDFIAYHGKIPETGAAYEMIPIKGGVFTMGSPEDEGGRFDDEGPPHHVQVDDFWMGKYEVTWEEYRPFMESKVPRGQDGYPTQVYPGNGLNDWSSGPSTPYLDMAFGMNTGPGYPAICMTHHAASKYCQWRSAQTGHFYRLPTEAEWEYACRSGSSGPFSCPEAELKAHAIIDSEQIRTSYVKVGQRQPNPWGLYDMHGNLFEWTLDGYDAQIYANRAKTGGIVKNPWVKPTQRYPRVARGGSWYDPASECRSARRIFSSWEWQAQDPMLPRSLWYLTDALWLGFRIVRATEIPEAGVMYEMWNSGDVHLQEGDEMPDEFK